MARGGNAIRTLEMELIANVARLQKDMREIQRAVSGMEAGVAKSTKAANDNLSGFAGGVAKAGTQSRLAGHHVQNLTFQLQDLFVGLASGQKPMTVFLQQGTQIAGIMGQAGIGVKGLAKELGGMVVGFGRAHPVLATIAATAAVAGGSLAIVTNQLNDSKRAEIDRFTASLGLTSKELAKLGPIGITVGDVFVGLWRYIEQGLGLGKVFQAIADWSKSAASVAYSALSTAAAGIYAAFIGTYDGIKAIWPLLPSVLGDAAYGAANLVIRAMNGLLDRATQWLNNYVTRINLLLSFIPGFDKRVPTIDAPEIGELGNPFAGSGRAAGKAFAGGYAEAFGEAKSVMAREGAKIGDFIFDAMKDRVTAEAKAKGFLDPEAAKKGGKKAGKDAGDAAAKELLKAIQKGFDDAIDKLDAMPAALKNLFRDVDAEWEKILHVASISHGQERFAALESEAEKVGALREEYERLAGVFEQFGSGKLADALRLLQGLSNGGDFSGVGGKAGFVLNELANVQWTTTDKDGNRMIHRLGEEFATVLDGVFGKNGDFFKTLAQGAALGGSVGGILFGGNKSAQLGSTIGGALGEIAGKAIGKKLGGMLGEAAGPLGAIAGSILGGLVGGLFKKTKSGSATLGFGAGGLGVASVGGNSGSRKQAASGLGRSIVGGLESIAEQLGGSLDGPISISIGVRDKSIRVDPTGSGATKKSKGAIDFGQDEAAAIKFAIADAIKDGAITGLRAGTMALLNAGDDIEKQLGKALKFQNVFDELKQRLDPLGFAMEAIGRETEQLQKIFKEAGATAAEYAQLEQLLQLKRDEAIEEARQKAIDDLRDKREMEIRVLELLGRREDAVAAARELEVAGLKASLQPLQKLIYQLEDAREVIDTFSPLLDDLKAYRAELLGGGAGQASFAFLRTQFGSNAALAASGDATALGALRGSANSFLEAARDNASSALDYRRAVGEVLAAVDKGIFAADAKIDYAQLQIDAINNSTTILGSIEATLDSQATAIAENTAKLAKMWERYEADGLTVKTDADTPIAIASSAASPIYVDQI